MIFEVCKQFCFGPEKKKVYGYKWNQTHDPCDAFCSSRSVVGSNIPHVEGML